MKSKLPKHIQKIIDNKENVSQKVEKEIQEFLIEIDKENRKVDEKLRNAFRC